MNIGCVVPLICLAVAIVAIIILGIWSWKMDAKLKALEEKVNKINPATPPIVPAVPAVNQSAPNPPASEPVN